MSLNDYRGSVYAFQRLMQQAAKEIAEGGEIKPAIRKWKTANPARVSIGWFRRRLLRGEFRRRA